MADRGKRLTVLIADDHPVYRQGLARAIKERPELDLIATCEDGRDALERITSEQPDVAARTVTSEETTTAVVRQALIVARGPAG